jgi:hypothetical protein
MERRIPDPEYDTVNAAKQTYNFARSNCIYLERFLELHRRAFTAGEIDSFIKVMRARKEKVRIAHDHVVFESEEAVKKHAERTGRRVNKNTRILIAIAIVSLTASAAVGILGLLNQYGVL